MKKLKHILCSLLLIVSVVAWADIPSRPQPQRLVNDFAGLFSSQQIAQLEGMLVAFDDTTSNQITVVTVKDLEGYSAADYATRLGINWQVGSADFNNGIVVLVKPKTLGSSGQVFIAVGYGLEGAIPDAYTKRIVEGEMIPHFQEGNMYRGVYEACETLMKLASGEISEPRDSDDAGAIAALITFIFVILVFVLVAHSAKKSGGSNNSGHRGGGGPFYTGPIFTTRPSSFGGFGGGGGFGGFGGFGGGSFGGGGAGGSW